MEIQAACLLVLELGTIFTLHHVTSVSSVAIPDNSLCIDAGVISYRPHPDDCSKFYRYRCIENDPIEINCPSGTVFSEVSNALCVQRHSEHDTCKSSGDPEPVPVEISSCSGGAMYKSHPDHCDKLYQCVHGHFVEMNCASGTVFSEVENVCVHRVSEQDTCTPANVIRECQSGLVDTIPHPTACQRYYNCSDTTPRFVNSPFQKYEKECTYPEVFDINQRKCVHYENAVCGKGRIAATWKCDYLANRCHRTHCKPCNVDNPSCVGKEDGYWPHPERLWSPYYVECLAQRTKNNEERCTSEGLMGMTQLFHPVERKCLPLWDIPREHGGYKPSCDAQSGDGIHEVSGMEIVSYRCPGEEKYLCRPPYSYHHDITRCTPIVYN